MEIEEINNAWCRDWGMLILDGQPIQIVDPAESISAQSSASETDRFYKSDRMTLSGLPI
ncbi:hypothetical protein [Desulfococcus multivorans]|uniref:hypothetical protein n=1 Tax=Desulfococcus TaxID=896 RepID=UPI0003F78C8A|nr:hypothetical protein [Desulfococcus multivorans]